MTRAVLLPVEGPSQALELPDDNDGELRALQGAVGGYIEALEVLVPNEDGKYEALIMWLNEEGKLKGLARNPRASALAKQVIAGDVVITGEADPLGETTTLTDEMYQALMALPDPAEMAGPYVMVNMGMADGTGLAAKGGFLESFDPEYANGRGSITWTRVPSKARTYTTKEEAWAEWHTIPRSRPVRPDGKPNKPLTAWHVMVQPLSDFDGGAQIIYYHLPEDGDHRRRSLRDLN